MAEAAGIAIGAVALVTLFQTCIETCEYIESGRDLMSEVDLVVTKVHLLKARLHQLGATISIDTARGGEVKTTCDQLPSNYESISGGLNQINRILQKTLFLSGRYCLAKGALPAAEYNTTLDHHLKVSAKSDTYDCYMNEFTPTTTDIKEGSSISLFLKRISWAIRDKKKLNAWLLDLDFLITSLEELKEGNSGPMPPSDTKLAAKKSSAPKGWSRDRRERSKSSSALVLRSRIAVVPPSTSPPPTPGAPPTSQPAIPSAHTYGSIKNTRGNAVEGNVGPFTENQGGVGHRYDKSVAEDSMVVYGNVAASAFHELLQMSRAIMSEVNRKKPSGNNYHDSDE